MTAPDEGAALARHQKRSRRAKPGIMATVTLVLGELLITAGVLICAFVAWQTWYYDPSISREQSSVADEYVQQWQQEASSDAATDDTSGTEDATVSAEDAPVAETPAEEGEVWGVMYVPRFGSDWKKPVAWGTDMATVLNTLGIGTYEQSVMPGAVGNTIVAAHRSGQGSGFYDIHKLRLGDEIIIETEEGWYTYAYRNTEYIVDTDVQLLSPVPMKPEETATGKILSLQSCNPLPVSNEERIIAYAVLESFTPREAGAPQVVQDMGGGD